MEPILVPAANFSAGDLATLFCSCFSDYFVPLNVDAATIHALVRRDNVDLARSRVVIHARQPCGFILLAFRGHGVRIAAMGVDAKTRRCGLGRRMVEHALAEGRASQCSAVVLEVITVNDAAVRLYESFEFGRAATLFGFSHPGTSNPPSRDARAEPGQEKLEPTTPSEVADWVEQHGDPDLPWQIAAESIRAALPGCAAFALRDQAVCLISDPTQARIALLSLVVHPDQRRRGVGGAMIDALMRQVENRTWRVPEIIPQGGSTKFLVARGWQASAIQQFLMKKTL